VKQGHFKGNQKARMTDLDLEPQIGLKINRNPGKADAFVRDQFIIYDALFYKSGLLCKVRYVSTLSLFFLEWPDESLCYEKQRRGSKERTFQRICHHMNLLLVF
jgi:hypothetical protein